MTNDSICEDCGDFCKIPVGSSSCADGLSDNGSGDAESLFSRYFWYFLLVSGVFLIFSLLFDSIWDRKWLSQLMALISVSLSSQDVVKAALSEIKRKRLGASTLMFVAAIGAFFILHGQEGAMAIFLYSIAERLEDISADKARDAISKLMELTPETALLKTEDGLIEKLASEVKKGEIIVVKPGMKVALDGIIISGGSYFDTKALTGEAIPKLKDPGDMVYASSINGDNLVEIQVVKESGDTLLARITESVRKARLNKSNTEKFIERFGKYYTPVIFFIAISLMVIPSLLGDPPIKWIYRGLILLVISCPCALTLSTPLSMVAALTKLSREGILVKGGKYIEALKHIRMMGFDKTATLTEGRLKLFDNVPESEKSITPERNLQIIASLENNSSHPIAKAIVSSANEINLLDVDDFKEVKGKGIEGHINGRLYRVGSIQFFQELGIKIPLDKIRDYMRDGKTPVLLAEDDDYLGMVTVRDNLRVSASIVTRGLKNRGIKTFILSGDSQETVDSIADCLYIDVRFGNLLPDDKLRIIKEIQERGIKVAMVGDGINDAPALNQADVGIAMGASGSDIALESADVTIMNDDLTKILTVLDIQKTANRIIKENVYTSIIIKLSFAVLTFIGLMTLALAVGIGDMGVSLFVILNGFRVFAYESHFQKVTIKDLEVTATRLVCEKCKTTVAYPQHHGREMVPVDDNLVCWKSLAAEISSDACKETLSLRCPVCHEIQKIE
ncbi:MAG: heavy metal translocating P-type ATPase [Promethearchaeota archaeon]